MKLSRLGLWTIILLLLLTNIVTLFIFLGNEAYPLAEGKNNKQALAVIGKEEINYQEWISQLVDEHGEQVLNDMVDKKVIHQLAEDKNFKMEPQVIDREIARMMTMQGLMSEEAKEEKIEKWREQIESRYLLQYLLTENAALEEEEIQRYYQQYKGQYRFDEMVQLSHILVETQPEAELAFSKLEEGATFQEIAEEFSVDQDTADNGGYLGFYTSTSSFIPAQYFEVAKTLEEGSYSTPFTTDNGYAILYHHQHLEEIELTYEEAREEVRQDLALDKLDRKVDARFLWDQLEVDILYDK